MRKKRNFLVTISSILGVIAVCGFSLFSSFRKPEVVSAYTQEEYVNMPYGLDYVKDSNIYKLNDSEFQVSVVYTSLTRDYVQGVNISYLPIFNVDVVINEISSVYSTSLLFKPFALYDFNDDEFTPIYEYDNSTYRFSMPFNTYYYVYYLSISRIRIGEVANTGYIVYRLYANDGESTYTDDLTLYFNTSYSGSYQPSAFSSLPVAVNFYLGDSFNVISNSLLSFYSSSYNSGLDTGYSVGYQDGINYKPSNYEQEIQEAYNNGRIDGYNEGFNADSTATTIISGIFQVALVPINFFLGIFNFEILGINFSSLIQALFTVAITIIILKAVLGKKGD